MRAVVVGSRDGAYHEQRSPVEPAVGADSGAHHVWAPNRGSCGRCGEQFLDLNWQHNSWADGTPPPLRDTPPLGAGYWAASQSRPQSRLLWHLSSSVGSPGSGSARGWSGTPAVRSRCGTRL
jgi:hypothetical protein